MYTRCDAICRIKIADTSRPKSLVTHSLSIQPKAASRTLQRGTGIMFQSHGNPIAGCSSKEPEQE